MIDSHCHLDQEPLENNLENVLIRSKQAGIEKLLTISTTLSSFQKILKLIQFALASVIILILGKISFTSISFILFGILNYFIYLFDIVFKEFLPSRFSTFIFNPFLSLGAIIRRDDIY